MKKVTADEIRKANLEGLNDPQSFWDYYTPTLSVALDLGRRGISLQDAPVVSGIRYGKAPDGGISNNYRDGISERGLSLAKIDGAEEVGSVVWFEGREEHRYTGILLPYKGSDGEALILAEGVDNLD
jgi:hypothetical protein